MKPLATIFRICSIVFIAFTFVSWSKEAKKIVPGAADIFIYEFHEPMHCGNTNYKITVTSSTVYLTIDKFGTILYRDSAKLSAKQYSQFIKTLLALNIAARERTDGPCVGSSSQYLQLYAGSSKEIKGMYSSCSPGSGTLAGDIPAAAELFKALVPGLDKKVDKIREDESGEDPCLP